MAPQREWLERDYYATLGVSKEATADEIKRAYRRLARELHPDANPDDPRAEGRFKEVGEAYAVVGDPERRREYDELRRLGAAGFAGGFPGGAGGFPGGFPAGFGGADLGDLLGQMFGAAGGARGGRGRARPRRGADLETDLHLAFEDALEGVSTTVVLTAEAACETCRGTGAADGTRATCAACGGRGETVVDQGPFSFAQPCARCGGAGSVVESPCRACRGSGRVTRPRRLQVRIPAGVRDGAVVRLAGRGAPGRDGGPAGDVLVRVRVAAHPRFGRRGDDVTLELPLTFAEAALGATVAVPTPSGERRRIRIAPGTQAGRVLRVRGEGAPRTGGRGRGDLLVTVRVRVPERLSRAEKRLLEQLGEHDDRAARDRALFEGTSARAAASEPATADGAADAPGTDAAATAGAADAEA
jgi:molecular chaperone DnaJ